jgi:hypothetical protein
MNSIDVFYQREGVRDTGHIEAPADATVGWVKGQLIERAQAVVDCVVFLEDSDESIEAAVVIEELAKKGPVRLHLHPCRHVEVSVTYNGRTVTRSFGPGTTIARIKGWAAEKLGIAAGDASELLLQIRGTMDRPSLSTHVGTLVKCPHCAISFDFVTNVKVNG